jgi:hypothetical protein
MNARNRARTKLLLIAALCASPVLASWAMYVARVQIGQKSVGQLLPTHVFTPAHSADWPSGKWVLVGVARDGCADACQQRLFALRQIQVAQGEHSERLQRVLLSATPLAVPNGTQLLQVEASQLPQEKPGFYLIDPLGNQVMFYSDRADRTRVIRELTHILKTNNGLG